MQGLANVLWDSLYILEGRERKKIFLYILVVLVETAD
jgi:hypothetical protein